MKKLVFLFLLIIMCFCLCGCSSDSDIPVQIENNEDVRYLRLHIKDYGSIDFKIFTDEEETAGNRLLELAGSGYYNGKGFNTFIKDYLMMAGEIPADSETENNSEINEISGTDSENTSSDAITVISDCDMNPDLYPLYGSLCVSLTENGKADLSQLFIIMSDKKSVENINELVEYKGYTFSDYMKFGYNTETTAEDLEIYREYGGAPWLQGHVCVLGQAADDTYILEKICEDYYNGNGEDVFIIENAEIDRQ